MMHQQTRLRTTVLKTIMTTKTSGHNETHYSVIVVSFAAGMKMPPLLIFSKNDSHGLNFMRNFHPRSC